MSPEELFTLSTRTAMLGWLFLLLSPFIPKVSEWVAGRIIPAVLALIYTALVMVNWGSSDGGFGTLTDVMALFTQPEIVLIGWLHYLAFDLFIGAWECRTARREAIPFLLVIPCLVLTLLFGPAGLLTFLIFRVIIRVRTAAVTTDNAI